MCIQNDVMGGNSNKLSTNFNLRFLYDDIFDIEGELFQH